MEWVSSVQWPRVAAVPSRQSNGTAAEGFRHVLAAALAGGVYPPARREPFEAPRAPRSRLRTPMQAYGSKHCR